MNWRMNYILLKVHSAKCDHILSANVKVWLASLVGITQQKQLKLTGMRIINGRNDIKLHPGLFFHLGGNSPVENYSCRMILKSAIY